MTSNNGIQDDYEQPKAREGTSQRPWDSLAYALACVGEEDDLEVILSASKRVRTSQARRTILLAFARLLGCKPKVYRVLLTREFDRESSLLELLRHQFRRYPELREVLNRYSEVSHGHCSSGDEAD